MSRHEVYVGELFEMFLQQFNFKESADLYKPIWDYETGFEPLEEYHQSDYQDAVFDRFDSKYIIIDDKILLVTHHINELDPYGFSEMRSCSTNEDEVLQFTTSFYNGGTCLSESIEEMYLDYRRKQQDKYVSKDDLHEARKSINTIKHELYVMFDYYANFGDQYKEVMTTIAKSRQNWRLQWFERLITNE